MSKAIEAAALEANIQTRQLTVSKSASLPKGARLIVLVEVEEPLLSKLDHQGLRDLRSLFSQAYSIIWVTSGSLIRGRSPEMALAQGLAKVIHSEYPSLVFSVVDVESVGKTFDYELQNRVHVSQVIP